MRDKHTSDSFRRFVDDLTASIGWVESLGLKVVPGRFGDYERLYEAIPNAPNEEWFPLALAGLEAGQELSLIRRHLGHLDPIELKRRLHSYVSGPGLQRSENPSSGSTQPRDIGFELVLGAQLSAAGLRVQLGRHWDLEIEGERKINLECKRPQSVEKLEAAFRKAANQLVERATLVAEDPPTGIVAISIGRIVHGGAKFLPTPDLGSAIGVLDATTSGFVRSHDMLWQSTRYAAVHAVLIDLSTPVHVTSTNQWLWGHFDELRPVNNNPSQLAATDIGLVAAALTRRQGLTRF